MILTLAWRNIWRNRNRSLILMTAIALGMIAALVLDAFYLGMIRTFINDSINKTTSHIQIHHPDFIENERVTEYIENASAIVIEINQLPEVKAASSRIVLNAMMATGSSSRNVRIKAIDLLMEPALFDIGEYIQEGEVLDSGSANQILISTALAEKLKARIGSRIVLTYQDMLGEITNGLFRVKGLFDTGNDMIDDFQVFVSKKDLLRSLFSHGSDANSLDHEIAILLNDITRVDTIITELKASYPELQIRSYREIAPELDLYESQISTMSWFYFIIVMAALIFGIINTMLMAVLERYREIGVLMAIGMSRYRIFRLILYETVMLCITSAPVGILVGLAIIKYLSWNGINLSAWSETLEQYGMSPIVYPQVNPDSFLKLVISIGLTAILAAIYPSIKAVKLNPLEAIRKI